jgi:hypothetical protein
VPTTISCTADLSVDGPAPEALALFTPEGERPWAHGWDPHYPKPGRHEGPGAVFVTRHGTDQTVWVMVDQGPEGVRYTRVSPEVAAGTVSVSVVASEESSTRLRVDYDLTALSDAGAAWLADFEAQFPASIAEWESAIASFRSHHRSNHP